MDDVDDDEPGSQLIELKDLPPDIREKIDALSPEAKATLHKAISVTSSRIRFSGPLPPPGMLGEYEKNFPGSADRIIKLAEN